MIGRIIRHGAAALAAALTFTGGLAGAAYAQDATPIVQAASRVMGVEGLSSIHYYGTAELGTFGQNNNSNQPWPTSAANDYVRAIDFSQPASYATWTTFDVPVTGGAATLGKGQQAIGPQSPWAQQLEIWITPWGFLKGAAANGATVKSETVNGRALSVVSWNAPQRSPGGQAYRVVGYINAANVVERVETWVENSVYGDLLVETDYSFYRDNNGLKFPSRIVQKRAGWPVFEAYVLGAWPNPPTLSALMAPPPPTGGARAGGPPPANAAAASEKLADGVWRIRGGYNALAVEFSDYVLLFEPGPQNETRAQAIIAETRRLVPGKPIRYGVISHHHFDHTGGLEAIAAEGITIVTPAVNKAFWENAFSGPRTLAPDALAKSGRKPTIEGFEGDLRVFEDRKRRFEVHVVKGLPHADGMVIGYLPKERILIYADMFNLPTAAQPVPNPPVVGTKVFLDNIERLKLKPTKIMSVHTLNPDRYTTVEEIRASLGR